MNHIECSTEKLNNLSPHKTYHTALKKLKAKPKNISWGIKDSNGAVLNSKNEILDRWNGKSPGLDNIISEYIKSGGEPIISALHHLFNYTLTTGKIPQLFKEALIVVIYKKGSRVDYSNYRPISLLSHVYKLSKAFDSVKLSCLWNLLDKTSINKKYINLLKQSYENSKAYIETDIGTSRCVYILKGVKQGDVLSAILFCIVIAALVLQVENSTGGYNLSNLSYADDIAVISHKLSSKNDGLAAVKHRIGLGWAAFNKNKDVLTSKRIPYHLKSKIFNTYVIPDVLYGLECVNWTLKSLDL
nr:uncharacterized protein LOC113808362 [Penaeus vannamei]